MHRTCGERTGYLLSFERPSVPGLNALAYLIFEVLLQTGVGSGLMVVETK